MGYIRLNKIPRPGILGIEPGISIPKTDALPTWLYSTIGLNRIELLILRLSSACFHYITSLLLGIKSNFIKIFLVLAIILKDFNYISNPMDIIQFICHPHSQTQIINIPFHISMIIIIKSLIN